MEGQLYIVRPFGIEGLWCQVQLVMGEGWEWKVMEFQDGGWSVIDSGTARSSRGALRALRTCLTYLEHSPEF